MRINSICVFCGSSLGRRPEFREAAESLGREIGQRNLTLVYGGGDVGLMGAVARTALDAGGSVIGVIPESLVDQEIPFDNQAELRVVGNMHERKATMAELSDAFIALPGGFGTLEEFFEVITWLQLGIHSKPCGLMNVNNYYDKLLEFLDHAVEEFFIDKLNREMIVSAEDPAVMIDRLAGFQPQTTSKAEWIRRVSGQPPSS